LPTLHAIFIGCCVIEIRTTTTDDKGKYSFRAGHARRVPTRRSAAPPEKSDPSPIFDAVAFNHVGFGDGAAVFGPGTKSQICLRHGRLMPILNPIDKQFRLRFPYGVAVEFDGA
jgi:hypothetical protein